MSIFDRFKQIEKGTMPTGKIQFLIAGLGNPGLEYNNTRHNVGFFALDTLAEESGISVTTMKFKSNVGDGMVNGVRCLLMKPTTYMNNSGEAIAAAAQFYKIPSEHIIVFSDDVSMDLGKVRVRKKGSAGGHNGLKSIIALLGTETFSRIKIGVGAKPSPDYDLADWVLGKFSPTEHTVLDPAITQAIDACKTLLADLQADA